VACHIVEAVRKLKFCHFGELKEDSRMDKLAIMKARAVE